MEKGFTYILTNKNAAILYVGATKILKIELIVIGMGLAQILQKNIMLLF